VAGCCECGNEPSGSIKCEEFRDCLRLLASQEGLCTTELHETQRDVFSVDTSDRCHKMRHVLVLHCRIS
jgi:hypothetical protein